MQRSIRNPSFAAGIVRPAQIHLRVRSRRRTQTARSCWRRRWQRCCRGNVGIRRVAPSVERQDSIPVVGRRRAARVAVAHHVRSYRQNFCKAGATGTRAALDSESIFAARIVGPAQIHLSVRTRRRGQTARSCRGGGGSVVALATLEYDGVASSVERQGSIPVIRRRRAARITVARHVWSDRSNFRKARATCTRAALDSESIFTARIVRPAQIHLSV